MAEGKAAIRSKIVESNVGGQEWNAATDRVCRVDPEKGFFLPMRFEGRRRRYWKREAGITIWRGVRRFQERQERGTEFSILDQRKGRGDQHATRTPSSFPKWGGGTAGGKVILKQNDTTLLEKKVPASDSSGGKHRDAKCQKRREKHVVGRSRIRELSVGAMVKLMIGGKSRGDTKKDFGVCGT